MNATTQKTSSEIVKEVNDLLGRKQEHGEKAIALAIVLRDRLEAQEGLKRDPTSCILADMLVRELEFSPEGIIMDAVWQMLIRAEKANC